MLELHGTGLLVLLLLAAGAFALAACIGARRADRPALARRHATMAAVALLFSIVIVPGVAFAAIVLPITIADVPLLALVFVAIAMFHGSVALLAGERDATCHLDEHARLALALGVASLVIARIEGAPALGPATVFGAWSMATALVVRVSQ